MANGVSPGAMTVHRKGSIRIRGAFLGKQLLSWELKDKEGLAKEGGPEGIRNKGTE